MKKMKKEKKQKTSLGLEENIEGALCYVILWITGLIFLLLERESKFVKFHALQSIIVFLGLTVVGIVVGIIPFLGWIISALIGLLSFVLWVVLIVKAYQGEKFKIPIAGDLAEKYSA
ncbi:MAG: DUF4870 domain-containing protein [Candidatus Aenigmarchaeota archaeon]|nr:DUF4870 domain-containing protein [Candidatus Aenigmarchaeota archaeon]